MPRSFARSTGKRYAFTAKPADSTSYPLKNPIVQNPQESLQNPPEYPKSLPKNLPSELEIPAADKEDEKPEESFLSKVSRKAKISLLKSRLLAEKIVEPEVKTSPELRPKFPKRQDSDDFEDYLQESDDEEGEDSENKYSCPDCGKSYSTQSNLSRHKQIHRSMNDKKAKTCPVCAKVYVSIPAYSMHVRTHNQNCRCPICGSTFSRPWLAPGTPQDPYWRAAYKCQICSKDFADRSNLRAHKQTHSQLKPFECELCKKPFALKSYLSKHRATVCTKRV